MSCLKEPNPKQPKLMIISQGEERPSVGIEADKDLIV